MASLYGLSHMALAIDGALNTSHIHTHTQQNDNSKILIYRDSTATVPLLNIIPPYLVPQRHTKRKGKTTTRD